MGTFERQTVGYGVAGDGHLVKKCVDVVVFVVLVRWRRARERRVDERIPFGTLRAPVVTRPANQRCSLRAL